jgi:membrane protease YdiL (CAAX protease family)
MSDLTVRANRQVDERRYLWIEMGAVAAFYILPKIWSAVARSSLGSPVVRDTPLWLDYLGSAIVSLSFLIPVLFIAWNSEEGVLRFGLKPRGWKESIIGFFALIVAFASIGVLYAGLASRFGNSPHHGSLTSNLTLPIVLPWLLAALSRTLTQEFILRGYFLARIEQLSGKVWIAIATTAILGVGLDWTVWYAAVPNLMFGLVLGATVKMSGSIWPGIAVQVIVLFVSMGVFH